MLSERGWTIEYIMSLTFVQLDCLLKGIKQLNDIRSKAQEKANKKNIGKKKGTPEINDAFSMMSLPGFKVSPEAREKIIQLMKNKAAKKANKNG